MDVCHKEQVAATLEQQFARWLSAALGTGEAEPGKDVVRKDAVQAFRSIKNISSVGPGVRETSLAKLLKDLGPALTKSLRTRVFSLNIIQGALEGLQGAELSLGTSNLLVSFFLEQCAPVDSKDREFGEDYDEQIRDLSLRCLSSLMKCYLGSRGNRKESTSAAKLLCSASRQAVERRCALADDDEDYQRLGLTGMGAMVGGLSNLPRSRRSLCFGLLQSAVDGVECVVSETNKPDILGMSSKLAVDLPDFVSFVCSCLQGESDPRCLMQLLVLFSRIQVAFEPIFKAGNFSSFPITVMFDAVAPYYPINFTPPPHDNHGITKSGLKSALMSVLSCFAFDGLATRSGDTMINLSLGIVLERLIPLEGGDDSNLASSTDEKQEAVEDLSLLLFPAEESTFDGTVNGQSIAQLSKALVYTHHEAALAVSRGGSDILQNKLLADTCRSLSARIAWYIESAENKLLWNIFVGDVVGSLLPELDSNLMENRTAMAYLASLAASGGPQTLRLVLTEALEKCIRKMKENLNVDEESATIAAYGIGSFFSACNIAVEQAKKRGIVLHPHPTDKFCTSAFEVLTSCFSNIEKVEPLRAAALIALEALLVICPSEYFDDAQEAILCQIITDLVAITTEATESIDFSQDFMLASSKTLGALIGGAFVPFDENERLNNSVLLSPQVQDALKNALTHSLEENQHLFLRRVVLARACSSNEISATWVIEALLSTLDKSLELHSLGDKTMNCASALNVVLREGGPGARKAFHAQFPRGMTVFDIINKLSSLDPRSGSSDSTDSKCRDITSLNLPPTETELAVTRRGTQEVVTLLLPAYETCVPANTLIKYLSVTAKILPPLSNSDITRLSIILPLLAAALENGTMLLPDDPGFHSASDLFAAMRADLASYAVSAEYDALSRTGAAACLSISITFFARENDVCAARQVLEEVAIPNLLLAYGRLRNMPKGELTAEIVDCLNLCMILGSAAACRGGMSASTADEMALFFTLLACKSKAVVPFNTKQRDFEIDFLAFGEDSRISAALCTASAFGSILRDDRRPLWKQRLTHKTLKSLGPTIHLFQENGAKATVSNLGFVAVVCHLICDSNLKYMNHASKGELLKIVVSNLCSGPFSVLGETPEIEQQLGEVKRLAISSLLRLSLSCSGLLSSYSESIMLGLLRAYASADALADIASKLLILQVIERLCHTEVRKQTLMTMKPAVISILGAAMNHPSRLMRTAALSVRNQWSTIRQE